MVRGGMGSIDKRNRLDEEVFSCQIAKDKVIISWQGKPVTVLKGAKSQKFISRIANADGKEAQLLMAKATGNFKRGNEKKARGNECQE